MKNKTLVFTGLSSLTAVLMSLPWLVPHTGFMALVGLVPLLIMERLAWEYKVKHFWWWHYGTFVLWNALTTWWIWNATAGGAVFAILANALQMSVVFGAFRFVKRRLGGVIPYIFLAAAWMAWERYYLTVAEISWPWLVLGNAFADTTSLVQWYSVLGHTGGSLWVWVSNLSVFGLMVALSDGRMGRWGVKARAAAFAGVAAAVFGPMIWSFAMPSPEEPKEKLAVVIGQPNFDPYHKFKSMTQRQQDEFFMDLVAPVIPEGRPSLILAPETFTSGFYLSSVEVNASFQRYVNWLGRYPQATFLYGVSGWESKDGKILSRNSALVTDASGRSEAYHKTKLVVGTELTPYPAVFEPLENLLGGNLMGKCVGQKERSCLDVMVGGKTVPFGSAVCYESVYGEFCTQYVKNGARFLAVITNDAWWGNGPGYRQHFNMSRLRAIETGRWIVRCGNTGLSGVISTDGKVQTVGQWWEPLVLSSEVGLSDRETPFVKYGDICGRLSILVFLLLGLSALVGKSKRRY